MEILPGQGKGVQLGKIWHEIAALKFPTEENKPKDPKLMHKGGRVSEKSGTPPPERESLRARISKWQRERNQCRNGKKSGRLEKATRGAKPAPLALPVKHKHNSTI